MMMTETFNVFYYTDAFISDKRTLSLLCILYDSVHLYYLSPDYFLKPLEERWKTEKEQPFFRKAPCESDLITPIYHRKHIEFIKKNKELVNTGVIRPILVKVKPPDWENFQMFERKMMEDYSGLAIGLWGMRIGLVPEEKDRIYVDSPYFSLYRWQSFSGALYFAIKANITPISDNPVLSSIACETIARFSDLNIEYNPKDLSKLLGFKVLSSILPSFGDLQPEQILEIRDDMYDELMAFRYEMSQIAIQSKVTQNDLDEILKFKIKPRVDDIKSKIASSKKALYHKIGTNILATGTSITLLTQFINLPAHARIAVGVGLVGKILFDYFRSKASKEEILSNSENRGLALLLDIEQKYGK